MRTRAFWDCTAAVIVYRAASGETLEFTADGIDYSPTILHLHILAVLNYLINVNAAPLA